MPLLKNHIAVITGAASGIGRRIADGYAAEGAHVILLDINGEAAAAAAGEIADAGYRASSYALDITQRPDCLQVARRIQDEVGDVTILVNNTGIVRRNGMTADADAATEDWIQIIDINLTGMFNVTQALLPPLRRNRGRIINLGSVLSRMHGRVPLSPAYTTSKHGVLGFTRALAAELGGDGVRVNALGPGLTETPINSALRAKGDPSIQAVLDHIPLGRLGQASDMIGPAIFLASDMSNYVTGTILLVDGGYHII